MAEFRRAAMSYALVEHETTSLCLDDFKIGAFLPSGPRGLLSES